MGRTFLIKLLIPTGIVGIPSPKYFVTLKVDNRAGKKSIIAPSFKDMKGYFHVGTSPVMRITKEFASKEPLLLKAFDPVTREALLINRRHGIMVTPALSKSNEVAVELTIPGAFSVDPYSFTLPLWLGSFKLLTAQCTAWMFFFSYLNFLFNPQHCLSTSLKLFP